MGSSAESVGDHLLTVPPPNLRLNRSRASSVALGCWLHTCGLPVLHFCIQQALSGHWCGLSRSWARPARNRSRCHFPGQRPSPQPSQVKQQGEQREEMGELFPKDWGWTLSLQRALCRRQGGLAIRGREAEVRTMGGYYLGSCIFISFLPVRFLELRNIHEVREAWKVMVRLSWIHPKSHIEIG